MAGRLGSNAQPLAPGMDDSGGDVRRVDGIGDGRGMLILQKVEARSRFVPAGVAGKHEGAGHGAGGFGVSRGGHLRPFDR